MGKNIPITYEGQGELLQPVDPEGFRAFNRTKTTKLVSKLMSEEQAIEKFVKSGDYIGMELYGTVRCPMSLTRALVRSGKKDFKIAGQGVHEMDLLLGADLIREVDVTYIGQEVNGISSIFRRRVENGDIKKMVEWSNAGLTWRFKAAAMGVPFLPTKCMMGTDTIKYSAAKVIECPFSGDKVALLPALVLDVGFIHVNRADKYGNCQIDGISGFAFEMSRASKRLIISAEEIVEPEVIRAAPDRTIIPYYLVDAVIEAPFGSWPGEMTGCYDRDKDHYSIVLDKQKSQAETDQYLKEWCLDLKDHKDLLKKIGDKKLKELTISRGEK